jgi:hypothetical protein
MDTLEKMVSVSLAQMDLPVHELAGCLARCLEAEAVATLCIDVCINSPDPRPLRGAQRRLQDAADGCASAVRVLCRSGQPDPSALRALLEACAALCRGAAVACAEHAEAYPPCALAAESCESAGRALSALLEVLLEAPSA